jgi:hypothetical protein
VARAPPRPQVADERGWGGGRGRRMETGHQRWQGGEEGRPYRAIGRYFKLCLIIHLIKNNYIFYYDLFYH